MNPQKLKENILLELTELKKLGVFVSDDALNNARTIDYWDEYSRGASIQDIVDTIILIHR